MTVNEALLQWFDDLIQTNNACYIPLFFDTHRYLVLKGGGGSGKSVFAGRKVLERVTTEPGHRWLVVRKVARTLRESCFAQLIDQIGRFYPRCGAKISRTEMKIGFGNGSEILFAGLDDTEKLKSIFNITGIWIEEASELTQSDFNQLDIRLRTPVDTYLQMILTFNPVSINHWLKKRFWDVPDKRARLHESTYRDNRFLPDEAAATLEAFRETDEYYYMVYCLNQWGVTGKTVFNSRGITARLEGLSPPVRRGLFEYDEDKDGVHIRNIRFTEDENGPIQLYALPAPGVPYVIGGDTAGDGSDVFVAQVLDNRTGVQVGTLRHRLEEDVYARQVYCLGRYYNDALVGIETNFSTYPVKLLELMGYGRLYVRESEEDYTGALTRSFGFRTTAVTRPVMIARLIKLMRDNPGIVCDRETLLEMLSFVRNEKLRPEAEAGAHDDCVMALAIAHHIRVQQRDTVPPPQADRSRWTPDMWEDYNNADEAQRDYLTRKWGEG